jgi:hypothetical protein
MRKVKFIAVFLLASMVLTACAGEMANSESDNIYASNSNSAPMASSQVAEKKDSGSSEENNIPKNERSPVSLDDAEKSKEEEPAKITERKIIRNATLDLETGSPEEAQQKITAIAENKKGFVITSTQRNTNAKAKGRNSVSMQIRVPSDKFQESLEEIRKTADRVIVETVTGQDVTEEFVDIEARLKTKKALEERFLEIMKTAKNVQDALNVETQLANVRTEIERIEGRKRFLENQASLSTINIELRTPIEISASSTGFFYELKQAISDGFEAALSFILFLVRVIIAILPFLIFVVLPILLLLRYFWRRYKKKRTARKIVEEEINEKSIIDVE